MKAHCHKGISEQCVCKMSKNRLKPRGGEPALQNVTPSCIKTTVCAPGGKRCPPDVQVQSMGLCCPVTEDIFISAATKPRGHLMDCTDGAPLQGHEGWNGWSVCVWEGWMDGRCYRKMLEKGTKEKKKIKD